MIKTDYHLMIFLLLEVKELLKIGFLFIRVFIKNLYYIPIYHIVFQNYCLKTIGSE